MKKFNKFLLVGCAALTVGLASLSIVMGQDDSYDKVITKPVEQVQSYFGIEDKVKSKYEHFISEDKQFLSQIDLPQEIIDTSVLLKHHTTIDKAFYPLMKFGQTLFNWSEEQKLDGDAKYEGKFSAYHSFGNKNDLISEYIILGVNGLELKNDRIYHDLYKSFGNDDRKLTSFLFFHELGHKVGHKILSQEKNMTEILKTFEKEKGITLNSEDKEIINSQYSETFADSFAIALMVKKYPDLDLEKTKEMIAGLRLNSGSHTHLSAPGVIQLSNIDRNTKINDIFSAAEKSALITTQFYSDIDFSKTDSNEKQTEGRDNPVKLINLDVNSVRQKIQNAREKFLVAQKSNDKGLRI